MNSVLAAMEGAVLLFLLSTSAQAAGSCDYGTPHREAPPETAQFGFLIGEFDIALHGWQGDGWSPPRSVGARWNGRYGLNGMAIYDEWFDPGPDADVGVWGVNVRTFDPAAEMWKMMWISLPSREVQDMRAAERDGTLTMWQVYPERPDWKAEFEVIDDDHWARVSFVRDDAGAWTPQYRLAATRIPCRP
jgi:hypothetical protein